MQLNVNLPAEIETALRRRAAAAGQDVEMYIAHVVTEELSDEVESSKLRPPTQTPEETVRKLREMIQRLDIQNGKFDDSRESIYAGCGE